jgi:hypothetical protein
MKVRTWDGTPFNINIVKNEFQFHLGSMYFMNLTLSLDHPSF